MEKLRNSVKYGGEIVKTSKFCETKLFLFFDFVIFARFDTISIGFRLALDQELTDICLNNNIDYILTAHHENDQIETIYMCKKNNSSWISKIGIREKFHLLESNKNKITVLRHMLSINKESIILRIIHD